MTAHYHAELKFVSDVVQISSLSDIGLSTCKL